MKQGLILYVLKNSLWFLKSWKKVQYSVWHFFYDICDFSLSIFDPILINWCHILKLYFHKYYWMLYTFYKGIKCGSTRMNAVKASKAQCWNYRFYVKPILSNFWRSKTALLTILVALNFDFLKNVKNSPPKNIKT